MESLGFRCCCLLFVSCSIRRVGYIGGVLVGNRSWTCNTGKGL